MWDMSTATLGCLHRANLCDKESYTIISVPLRGHLAQNVTFHNEGTKCHVTLPVLNDGDWYCHKTTMWVQGIRHTAATNTNSVS